MPTALIALSDAAAGWGVLSYGGYTFPGLRSMRLVGDPQWDDARRMIIFTRYRLEVTWYDHGSSGSHAATVRAMRRALQTAGSLLTITGMGFGDITVGDITAGPGAEPDRDAGPRPGPLVLNQIGNVSTECQWSCEFTIFERSAAVGLFREFTYTVDWSFDDAGFCTRTIAGHLSTFGFRTATTQGGNADQYRDQIRVAIPEQFRRKGPGKFTLSADRLRLDFVIVDEQLKAEPPPENAVEADLDFEIENNPPGFARWSATLSGSIKTPAGMAVSRAAEVFMRVFLDRQSKLNQAVASEGFVMPTRMRFGRTMGSNESRFGTQWMVAGCLDDLLKQGGIWEPVGGVNWAAWAQSMAQAWSVRGSANLAYNPAEDLLIDLGVAANLPQIGTGAAGPSPSEQKSQTIVFDVPKAHSWMYFENTLRPLRLQRSVTHEPLVDYEPPAPATWDPANETAIKMAIDAGSSLVSSTQYSGPPIDGILMIGKAMRVQHQPSIPRLVSIANKPVQEVKTVYEGPKPIACIFGKTIYSARWAILYRLTSGYLSEIPEQKNPALCCEPQSG